MHTSMCCMFSRDGRTDIEIDGTLSAAGCMILYAIGKFSLGVYKHSVQKVVHYQLLCW